MIMKETYRFSQITEWCHSVLDAFAEKEGFYIDATMGRGGDTLFLCGLAGEAGKVLAFDVQSEAVEATAKVLKENRVRERAELILEGHQHMDRYAQPESADVICFNFGYLPGSDHTIATRPDTSVAAVEKALDILKPGGILSLCIYSGGDTGFAEKEALLEFLRKLSSRQYTVIMNAYWNRGNNPPVPVFVFKKFICL